MMNSVEPYIIIMSPAWRVPTETASAPASMVPQVTGVPARSPVSAAACAVTRPAISVDHSRRGSISGGQMSPRSKHQSCRSMS